MSKRAPSPGLGERLKKVRHRLGYQNLADFARKIGQNYTTYRQWELFDSAPSAETLKKASRDLGVAEWRQLFLWLCDGVGDPPSWMNGKGDVPPAPEEDDDDTLPERPPMTGRRVVPIPWHALELLVQQWREAEGRKDSEAVKKIETAVRELVWPDVRREPEPRATTQDSQETKS